MRYDLDAAEAAMIDFARRRVQPDPGAKTERNAEIARLRASGVTWTNIGILFGISPQRCQQIGTRKTVS
jgi:hypothetical protein